MMSANRSSAAFVPRGSPMRRLMGSCVLAGLLPLCSALVPAMSSSARVVAPQVSAVALGPAAGAHGESRRPTQPPHPNWTAWLGTGLLSTGPALLANSRIAYLTRLCGATGL